jgi:hypothetical protein
LRKASQAHAEEVRRNMTARAAIQERVVSRPVFGRAGRRPMAEDELP